MPNISDTHSQGIPAARCSSLESREGQTLLRDREENMILFGGNHTGASRAYLYLLAGHLLACLKAARPDQPRLAFVAHRFSLVFK